MEPTQSKTISGRRFRTWVIQEENLDDSAAIRLDGCFPLSTLTLFECAIEAGTASTVQPSIYRASVGSGFTEEDLDDISTRDLVAEYESASDAVQDQTQVRITLVAGDVLWIEPNLDAGSDNDIRMVVTLAEGHGV